MFKDNLAVRPGCEVGESSAAAAAARQPGPTIETRLRDTERRMMTALEMVNRRVSYQVDVRSRESSEFHTLSRHHDAQKDQAAETEVRRYDANVRLQMILSVHISCVPRPVEAGATSVDTLEMLVAVPRLWRYRSFGIRKWHQLRTDKVQNHSQSPTPNETPTTTITEAQLQALIDQGVAAAMAKAEASRVRNGYNSNGTEGVVGLTRWFEKMESVFSNYNVPSTSQVKYSATYTSARLSSTWWNSHVKTTTPEAAPCHAKGNT
ncbi:hypothetical protein Tco_1029531 [Tanacetum coccineum]|uniref:Reverse transcriptase domain-containing protein n=1 Tax=Tanacetum coccineum TaxID=301880 RepID=A0ABQ5G541_9ASTR